MLVEKTLLAAERQGRELARRCARRGASLLLDAADDADGPGILAAARWAALLGVPARLRLGRGGSSPAWSLLADSARKQGLADQDGQVRFSRVLVQAGNREEEVPLPSPDEAWKIPLDQAAPLVGPFDPSSPALPPDVCREIDRRAIRDFGIPGICLMENAAVAALLAGEPLLPSLPGQRILIVAGGGNNGGDGLAMARGLALRGAAVTVALAKPPESLSGDAAVNFHLLAEAGSVPIHPVHADPGRLLPLLDGAAMVVDALLGTGFRARPSPEFERHIEAINTAGVPVLALDLPSGVDGQRGETAGAAIRATRTITFAAVKSGLRLARGPLLSGEVFLGDIGAPRAAFPGPG